LKDGRRVAKEIQYIKTNKTIKVNEVKTAQLIIVIIGQKLLE